MRAIIAQRLGNRGTALDTQIVLELQQAQIELELFPELPWFISTRNTSLSTTADSNTVTLPSTFIMVDEDKGFLITTSSGDKKELLKTEHKTGTVDEFLGNTDTNTLPEQYDILIQTMYLYPTPNAVSALELHYFDQDDVLSASTTENLWSKWAPDMLIAYAGERVARFNGFDNATAQFSTDFSNAFARMTRQNIARSMMDSNAKMGG